MIDETQQDALDRYWSGKMDEAERSAFESQLEKNPELREELNWLKAAAAAMEKTGRTVLKAQIAGAIAAVPAASVQKYSPSVPKKLFWKKWWWAVAVVTAGGIAIASWWFFFRQHGEETGWDYEHPSQQDFDMIQSADSAADPAEGDSCITDSGGKILPAAALDSTIKLKDECIRAIQKFETGSRTATDQKAAAYKAAESAHAEAYRQAELIEKSYKNPLEQAAKKAAADAARKMADNKLKDAKESADKMQNNLIEKLRAEKDSVCGRYSFQDEKPSAQTQVLTSSSSSQREKSSQRPMNVNLRPDPKAAPSYILGTDLVLIGPYTTTKGMRFDGRGDTVIMSDGKPGYFILVKGGGQKPLNRVVAK